jgi:hypothetical protein
MNYTIAPCPAKGYYNHCGHPTFDPSHLDVPQGQVHECYVCCMCGSRQCVILELRPTEGHGPFNPTKELVIFAQTSWVPKEGIK